MYMGHIGIGLGAKRIRGEVPLWMLLIAALLPDLVDAVGGLTPWGQWLQTYSHTLAGIAVSALAMGLVAFVVRAMGAAIITSLLVVSHLLADFVTSRIALWRSGVTVGLGLYNHHGLDFTLELLVILAGWLWYRRTLPVERRNHWACFLLLAVLVGFQFLLDGVMNVSA